MGAALSFAFMIALVYTVPARAQQSDAPSATKSASLQNAAAQDPPDPPPPDDSTETMFPHFKDSRFWLSGQANFIFQTHPPFPAAYSGQHSLSPNYEKATSRVMTLYTGVRLNNSTEILVDIEEAGGAALTQGFGLAGNTDLDIVRNPLLSKTPYVGRAMIHKVFALSKDKIENQRNFLSLFDELPRRRLELRFGKFSMPDFFDINSVGSDTHLQFINWTTDNNGAWDYAADTRGYTVGLTADYEDRNWGFRFAEALMPKVANGIDLVWKPWQAHAENFEYELCRGVIPKKAGVIRLLAYTNYANMGIYRDAVANFEAGLTPIPEITAHPWHITRKYGFGFNIEQNLTHHLSAFARRLGQRQDRILRLYRSRSNRRRGIRRRWRLVASQTRPRRHRLYHQCHRQRSPNLPRRWRPRLPPRRWQTKLRPRKHRRVLLHRPRVARHLPRTRPPARQRSRLQSRPRPRPRP